MFFTVYNEQYSMLDGRKSAVWEHLKIPARIRKK